MRTRCRQLGREFSRTERLLIRFDVYGNATPTAVLLNRERTEDGRCAGRGHRRRRYASDRSELASIATGEYLVEITVKGATGEAKEACLQGRRLRAADRWTVDVLLLM